MSLVAYVDGKGFIRKLALNPEFGYTLYVNDAEEYEDRIHALREFRTNTRNPEVVTRVSLFDLSSMMIYVG